MGIVQGAGVDTTLNETGILQSEAFYHTYQYIPFDKIYTSALKRTHQTVEPFLRNNEKLPWEIIAELNEINWGIMEGKLPTEESNAQFHAMLQLWKDGHLDKAVEGGETPLDMIQRQKVGLEKIMNQISEQQILLCMHGRAMRAFICLLTGTPLEKMDEFEHGNVCLYILEKRKEETYFRILLRNSRAHLHHLPY